MGIISLVSAPASAATGDILLPSGINAHLYEVIDESAEGGPVSRFRYVAKALDLGRMAPEAVLTDMTFLCQNNVLPQVAAAAESRTIVVSLADRPAPFGVMDSSVAQIFEVFSIVDHTCIWEAF